ncbi:hypothetical protein C8F04DRAFT_1396289 [Mycena alexandri]|uniref:Uncharacterized protein n=1 Tax=Mycena alexandri TaxID=1745969 RepID=A0AAD6SVA0_9AGAR|nr:hypothetical protein C8F04DRAFT_1396289 [Mycena alexandri]
MFTTQPSITSGAPWEEEDIKHEEEDIKHKEGTLLCIPGHSFPASTIPGTGRPPPSPLYATVLKLRSLCPPFPSRPTAASTRRVCLRARGAALSLPDPTSQDDTPPQLATPPRRRRPASAKVVCSAADRVAALSPPTACPVPLSQTSSTTSPATTSSARHASEATPPPPSCPRPAVQPSRPLALPTIRASDYNDHSRAPPATCTAAAGAISVP